MEQRYFKLLTNGGYHSLDLDLDAVYLMKSMAGDNFAYDLVIPNYDHPRGTLHFFASEVEEIFNYNPISDKVETVADQVFSSKTHLDNYDVSLDSKGERWIEEEDGTIVKDNKRVFESGSVRDNDDNKPLVDHLDPYLRLRFGYLLRDGAIKYGVGNWRLGQSDEVALQSLHRHLAKYELNRNQVLPQDEDHLAAIIFNVMLMMKNDEKLGIKVDHFFKGK